MASLTTNPVRFLAGSDPGRVRLTNALAVAASVLISSTLAWFIVRWTHGDSGYVTVGAFLPVQVGIGVRDATARQRLTTTALLTIPVAAGMTLMTLLDGHRAVEVALFIVIAGIATWVRRFGPRWSALGTVTFFACFFALFLRPDLHQLTTLLLIGIGAVASAFVVKLVLLPSFPDRSLRLLLREFRTASSAALATADSVAALHKRLARISDVGLAIHDWQDQYDTSSHTGVDATELARLLFDTRADTVQACIELATLDRPLVDHQVKTLVDALQSELLADPADASEQHVDLARGALDASDPSTPDGYVIGLLANALLSQHALRTAVMQKPDRRSRQDAPADSPVPTPPAAATQPEPGAADFGEPAPTVVPADGGTLRDRYRAFLHRQNPTTLMAFQVMVAAALATIAGEAISASRWYWAVLTAFLVFVGATTRAAILTRAFRRVLGTVLGVGVGIGLMLLADGAQLPMIIVCVVCVFGMVYFGPLNYAAMAFFVTVLLAAIFGLLGVLNTHLLSLRIEETLTGAAIGVACAFVFLSTSSNHELAEKIRAYFLALDDLLAHSGDALTGAGDTAPVIESSSRLDTDYKELQTFVAASWVSFAGGQRRTLRRSATGLVEVANIHAERLAQESVLLGSHGRTFAGDAAVTVRDHVVHVREQAAAACACLLDHRRSADSVIDQALDTRDTVQTRPHTREFRALLALAELSTTLRRIGRLRQRQ